MRISSGCSRKSDVAQGDHSPGKPGKVREFQWSGKMEKARVTLKSASSCS